MINIKKIIKEKEIFYYNIKNIRAVLFLNQQVFFNKSGLEHLVRKGKHLRNNRDQIRRLNLLKYVDKILQSYNGNVEYRCINNNKITTHFWGITVFVEGQKIKVVIRKINNGKLTFLSIMNQK